MFENICVFRDLALHVLGSQFCELDRGLLCCVAQLCLLFPLLLQRRCDRLVFPADLMGQAPKKSKLEGKTSDCYIMQLKSIHYNEMIQDLADIWSNALVCQYFIN